MRIFLVGVRRRNNNLEVNLISEKKHNERKIIRRIINARKEYQKNINKIEY